MKHTHHPLAWHQRVALRCTLPAAIALLSLAGCSLSPADPAAAAIGFGDTISDKTLNSIARPPIQVVYRFDDHRYIENNPEPGFNLPCQGELFYVDDALGIRTEVDGNKHGNPDGLFKVVNSPYVIARNDMNIYVSFDKGRTFKSLRIQVSGGADVVVVGNNIYAGGGGERGPRGAFSEWEGARWFVIDPAKQEITLKYREESRESEGDRIRKLARDHVVNSRYQDPEQYFTCKRDLPWRPSINRERQLQKQQRQNPSTANAS
ncbi:T6SS immunity protein Tli3 family protein [Ralstonia sp. 25C]|uniref:T6SS immunity protein Tli3 family protein n=1 Tax=Ralstonia sp. 25C TaxID=3447363 RepID=UPI003F74E074